MDQVEGSPTSHMDRSERSKDRPAGRRTHPRPLRRKITEEQELHVQRQVRYHSVGEGTKMIWDGPKVHSLVTISTGVDLPDRTFRTYMARWDLVPPRPLQLAYKKAPAAVKRWMTVDHPVLAGQAREMGARIMWLDVYRMRALSMANNDTAVEDHMLFLSDSRGHSEWNIGHGYPSPERLCWFLGEIAKNAGRRLHILVREKHLLEAPIIASWRAENTGMIELIPFLTRDP